MKTILAIFPNQYDAEEAISELEDYGYNVKDLSILAKEENVARSKAQNIPGTAVKGAVAGGVIGGIAGLLVGIGAILIPGLGAVLVTGPIAGALGLTGGAAGAVSGAATGVIAGGLVGGLVGLGVPEDSARIYEERVKQGGVLLAVPVLDDRGEEEVREIFEEYSAEQIETIDQVRDEDRMRAHRHSHRHHHV